MIEIRDLHFGYGKKRPLYRGLTLDFKPGHIYGLLGRNGAGKSTLLKTVAGLLAPQKGSITVGEWIPAKRQPSFLQRFVLIPEEVYVPPVGVERFLHIFSPFYPRFDREQFRRYLAVLEVDDHGRLNELSFGQQKKFIIAFSLACNPDVLLMDEPTNGLDIPSKGQFRKLISSVFDDNRIMVISTHQVRHLENLIDRVVIVEGGEKLLDASIEEVSEKLSFSTVNDLGDAEGYLYAEQSLDGYRIVTPKVPGMDSQISLEALFNAVTLAPGRTRRIFRKFQEHE
jgi:ABC-2 type transport system ATP-binding protein